MDKIKFADKIYETNSDVVNHTIDRANEIVGSLDGKKIKSVTDYSNQIFELFSDVCEFIEFKVYVDYWIKLSQPINKENFNETALKESLKNKLMEINKTKEIESNIDEIVLKVFNQILISSFDKNSRFHKDVAIENASYAICRVCDSSWIGRDFKDWVENDAGGKKIAEGIVLEAKATPIFEIISMGFFNIANVVSIIGILDKRKIIDLTKLAATIGTQNKVFVFVAQVGTQKITGLFLIGAYASGAFLATNNLVVLYYKRLQASDNESEEDKKALQEEFLNFLYNASNLASTALPLFLTVNPLLLTAFGMISTFTSIYPAMQEQMAKLNK